MNKTINLSVLNYLVQKLEHRARCVNKTKTKHTNNKKQHFSFTIFGENLLDTNVNVNANNTVNQLQLNDEKDLIIDELNQKINTLTSQLNNLNRKYKDKLS